MERKEIFIDKEVIFLEIVFGDTTKYIKGTHEPEAYLLGCNKPNVLYFHTTPKNFVVTEFVKLSGESYTELYL